MRHHPFLLVLDDLLEMARPRVVFHLKLRHRLLRFRALLLERGALQLRRLQIVREPLDLLVNHRDLGLLLFRLRLEQRDPLVELRLMGAVTVGAQRR